MSTVRVRKLESEYGYEVTGPDLVTDPNLMTALLYFRSRGETPTYHRTKDHQVQEKFDEEEHHRSRVQRDLQF